MSDIVRRREAFHLSIALPLCLCLLTNMPAPARAGAGGGIVFDGSLAKPIALTGPAYDIPAAAGQVHGVNLFHSFAQFNLASGESATEAPSPAE